MDKKTKKSPVNKPELLILDDASLKNVVGGTDAVVPADGTNPVQMGTGRRIWKP
jgi:hypothetical protein